MQKCGKKDHTYTNLAVNFGLKFSVDFTLHIKHVHKQFSTFSKYILEPVNVCVCVCVDLCVTSSCGLLTCAGHGGRVGFGPEEALVTGTGCGALAHRVAMRGTLGAAVIGGQSPVVANPAG